MNTPEKIELKRLSAAQATLQIEVGNNTKQLERIITNDLVHLRGSQVEQGKDIAKILGKLSIITPVSTGIAVGMLLLLIGGATKAFGLW